MTHPSRQTVGGTKRAATGLPGLNEASSCLLVAVFLPRSLFVQFFGGVGLSYLTDLDRLEDSR